MGITHPRAAASTTRSEFVTGDRAADEHRSRVRNASTAVTPSKATKTLPPKSMPMALLSAVGTESLSKTMLTVTNTGKIVGLKAMLRPSTKPAVGIAADRSPCEKSATTAAT